MEKAVFSYTSTPSCSTNSSTVFPNPFGYCSVTMTGHRRACAPFISMLLAVTTLSKSRMIGRNRSWISQQRKTVVEASTEPTARAIFTKFDANLWAIHINQTTTGERCFEGATIEVGNDTKLVTDARCRRRERLASFETLNDTDCHNLSQYE